VLSVLSVPAFFILALSILALYSSPHPIMDAAQSRPHNQGRTLSRPLQELCAQGHTFKHQGRSRWLAQIARSVRPLTLKVARATIKAACPNKGLCALGIPKRLHSRPPPVLKACSHEQKAAEVRRRRARAKAASGRGPKFYVVVHAAADAGCHTQPLAN